MKRIYSKNRIVILGYSMGSFLAAGPTTKNQPRLLILQAPYCSVADWMHHLVPSLDTTQIRYKLSAYLKSTGEGHSELVNNKAYSKAFQSSLR